MEDLAGLPYRFLGTLGEGAHGVVVLVEHTKLGKRFVVKLIQGSLSTRPDIVGRLEREARLLARFDHDAFVPIVDLGTTATGRTYFVMEYVEGESLQQLLRTRVRLEVDEALALTVQLLEGLAVAHDGGIVHRDLKPANLLVTKRGRIKILDFGIAKAVQQVDPSTGHFTAPGIAIGTPKYMSPEQVRGEPITYSADIYSAALILFEMIAGFAVFDFREQQEIMRAHLRVTPPTLSYAVGRAFPEPLEDLIARALRKRPAERFQTAREMAEACSRLLAEIRDAQGAVSASSVVTSSHDAHTSDELRKVTVRVSDEAMGSRASASAANRTRDGSSAREDGAETGGRTSNEAGVSTRPIDAHAIVLGAATTSPSLVAISGAPVSSSSPPVSGTDATEAIPVASILDGMPAPAPVYGRGEPVTTMERAALSTLIVAGSTTRRESAASPPVAPQPSAQDAVLAGAPASTLGARSGPSGLLVAALAFASVGIAVALFVLVLAVRGQRREVAPEQPAGSSVVTPPTLVTPMTSLTSPKTTPASSAIDTPAVASASAAAPSASSSNSAPATATAAKGAKHPPATNTPAAQHYQAAVAAMNAGDYGAADSEARAAIAAGGGTPAQLVLGQALEKRGKTAAAREVYRKILESNPSMSAAVAGLKRCGG